MSNWQITSRRIALAVVVMGLLAGPVAAPVSAAAPAPTPVVAPAAAATGIVGGSGCSGGPNFRPFFTDAANDLRFAVYCPLIGPDYWGEIAQYDTYVPFLAAMYTNARHYLFEIAEGNLCAIVSEPVAASPSIQAACGPFMVTNTPGYQYLGMISIGDMPAKLYGLVPPPGMPHMWIAWAEKSPRIQYWVYGIGMSKAGFIQLAGQTLRVHKTATPGKKGF
jgi:hypothetical protein